MTQVTIHHAKTHLSKLIRQALAGEEVIIAKGDQPVVRLEKIAAQKPRRTLGWAKGTVIRMAPDFNAELPEFEEYMAGDERVALARKQSRRRK